MRSTSQMENQLQRIEGESESCREGVFSFLRRDAEQTIFWTVRDVHDDRFSRWTLQIERDGDLQQSVSFAAVNKELQKNNASPRRAVAIICGLCFRRQGWHLAARSSTNLPGICNEAKACCRRG